MLLLPLLPEKLREKEALSGKIVPVHGLQPSERMFRPEEDGDLSMSVTGPVRLSPTDLLANTRGGSRASYKPLAYPGFP